MSAWKCYIPTAAFGLSTIACIMGANALNSRKQAALTSAYALINQSYKEYKDKLKELYGEEAHNAIVDSIVSEKCKRRTFDQVPEKIQGEVETRLRELGYDVNGDPVAGEV